MTLYQDCSSRHDLSKNMAGRGGAYFPYIYLYRKLEKIFLSETTGSILNITWQICFLGDPLPRLFKLSWFVNKHGWLERGLFSPYIYIENFNDLLVRNHWTDFNLTLQKCFLCNPLSRLCKPFLFIKKQGRQGAGLIFPIYLYRKTLKSLLFRNHRTDFITTSQKCFLGDPLPRLFK